MAENFQSNFAAEQPVRLYKIIAITFLVLTVGLLSVIIFMSSKRVTITIVSKTEVVDVNGTVEVGKGSNSITGMVTTTVVEFAKTFSPTGDIEEPSTAKGTVTLYNETGTDQPLIATTRILSPEGVLFRLKDKVVVPANGSIDAEVYSDTKGKENNIGPTKFTIPGLKENLQPVIYAESSADMTGGVVTRGMVTSEDVKKAQEVVLADLEEKGKTLLGNPAAGMKAVYSVVQNVFELDKQIGEEVSEFTVTARGTVLVVFYDEKEMNNKAVALLLRRSVNDSEIVEPSNTAPVVSLQDSDLNKGTATLNVFYSGLAKLNADSKQLQKVMFFDKNEDEVRRYALSLEHVHSVDVEFKPAWIRTVPPVDDHVRVVVKHTD